MTNGETGNSGWMFEQNASVSFFRVYLKNQGDSAEVNTCPWAEFPLSGTQTDAEGGFSNPLTFKVVACGSSMSNWKGGRCRSLDTFTLKGGEVQREGNMSLSPRSIIYAFLTRARPIPLIIIVYAAIFCSLNGFLQGHFLLHCARFEDTWLTRARLTAGESQLHPPVTMRPHHHCPEDFVSRL